VILSVTFIYKLDRDRFGMQCVFGGGSFVVGGCCVVDDVMVKKILMHVSYILKQNTVPQAYLSELQTIIS
jgi:hypothetical protein